MSFFKLTVCRYVKVSKTFLLIEQLRDDYFGRFRFVESGRGSGVVGVVTEFIGLPPFS